MRTNLIQNYIANPSANNYKDPKEFNIKEELANKTFIKPLPGKGRLIKANLFDTPGIMVKSLSYDLKAFKNGIKGEANDHELGKLNDAGLKLGALAIGAYLFTKKYTPKTKWMEFVGPATFLASMALWPKAAIQLPALLVHGTNVHKKYEDSFGRKKLFYQDPQFIPWDLYTDKQINKIGNRLGVPKNIPNRREFIQEKMKKIVVQNNTLWMLTAGFATPVMSALMCNAIEPYMLKYQNKRLNIKAAKMLDNMPKYAEQFKSNKIINNVETFMKLYQDKPITPELFEQLSGYITEGFDPITSNGIKEDLQNIIIGKKFRITKNTASNILNNSRAVLEQNFEHAVVEKLLPSESEMLSLFNKQKVINKTIEGVEMDDLCSSVCTLIKKKMKEYKSANPSAEINFAHPNIKPAISADNVSRILKQQPDTVLNKTVRATVRNLAKIMTDFNAKNSVILKYAYMKAGAAPETDYAYFAGQMNETALKLLNFTDNELTEIRKNPSKTYTILRSKLENTAANESEYKRVVSAFCEKLTQISKIDTEKYNELTDSIFNDTAAKFKELKMHNTVKQLVGENGNAAGSLLLVEKDFLKYRLSNVSTYQRFMNLLDFMRRVSTSTNLNALEGNIPKEIKEEQIEHTIKSLMDAHASDFSVKLPFKRNPHPNMSDMGAVTIENGRFKPQYYSTEKPLVELADTGGHFYRRTMKAAFENELHPESAAIYEKYSLLEHLKTYRKNMIEKIGNQLYDFKMDKIVSNINKNVSNEENFQLVGKSVNDWFTEAGRQAFNSRKWLKMFGKIGVGLVAATVMLQFTFGRMKTPKPQKTGVNKNA